MEITYLTEPVDDYIDAISRVASREQLLEALEPYRLIASDAIEQAAQIDDFEDFKRGLISERRGEFAGEEWADKYGAIILPLLMMRVMTLARHFGVPFGVAYIRCRDEGLIVEKDGIATIADD